MIPWLALFWTISSLIGDVVIGPSLWGELDAWRDLVRSKASTAEIITAWSHAETDLGLLWLQTVFLLFGLVGFTRPASALPQDWQGWVTTGLAMTLPWTITVLSIRARAARTAAQRRVLGGA